MRRDGEDVFEPSDKPWRVPWQERFSADDVIRALEPLVTPERAARLTEVTSRRLGNVVVVLDAPHDPQNGAAILRTSEAFGLVELHVVVAELPFVASRRVARGTEHWIETIRHPTSEAAAQALGERGFELVATHPEGELLPEDLRGIERLALVLGNEHRGISTALSKACRRSVRVPMRGFVESLNVGVSAAILLAAATRDRPGDLADPERRLLYARGLWRSVPRPADVLDAIGK